MNMFYMFNLGCEFTDLSANDFQNFPKTIFEKLPKLSPADVKCLPSRHLPVQSQQWKHENYV